MFSLINLILTIILLFRVFKYDKFFLITYDMRIKEDDRPRKTNNGKNRKSKYTKDDNYLPFD